MTSSNGNIFSVTGPLCGEFIDQRWISLTKASNAELWCFPWSAPEQTWVNNCDAGDMRRHGAHYDVTVMHWLLQMFAHVPTTMTIRWKQRRSFLLTHLSLDNMPAISQATFSGTYSWMKSFVFWFRFHWSLFRRMNDNKAALVQVMAWCWTCDNPLTELMLTPFTDLYTRHLGAVNHHGVVLCRAFRIT